MSYQLRKQSYNLNTNNSTNVQEVKITILVLNSWTIGLIGQAKGTYEVS
jgi:hypothetical protein